ncbi:hypothetical protein PVAP13_3NG249319, partial [Panicum virgatum]
IKKSKNRRKKQFPQAEKRERERRNESRRGSQVVAGATRGGWGHALTPDAGSRPEPSNAQRPPRRRRRRRRAASPTETNTSCLIFHARGTARHGRRIRSPPSSAHLPSGIARWVWNPAVAGQVRLSWSRPRAGSPCRPNRSRSVPREHFVSVVCKLC